jgi:hypothetical protein
MSEKRPKLTFDPNVPTEIVMLDSKPFWSGESFDKMSYGWGVKVDGEEMTVFATEYLNGIFSKYGKGDKLTVIKEVKDDKTQWNIIPDESAMNSRENIQKNGKMDEAPTQEYWENKDDLRQYQISRGQAWNLAFASLDVCPVKDGNKKASWETVIDIVAMRADQILAKMTDYFSLARIHLEMAKSVPHLENIWRKYAGKWKRELTEAEFEGITAIAADIKETIMEELADDEEVDSSVSPPDELF